MYSSINGVIFFGITVLFAISYQDKAKYYRDNLVRNYADKDSQSGKWACTRYSVMYMRWPDRMHRANQSDLWFDRLVYIHHEGNYDFIIRAYTEHPDKDDVRNAGKLTDLSVTVNGIIFEEDRILTSYNPFRQIIKFTFKRHFTHVCALGERRMGNISDDEKTRFQITYHSIACARQVVPLEETRDMPENLWHGKANKRDFLKQHSPLHDLMVIRTEGSIPNMTKDNYDFKLIQQYTDHFYKHGPQKTILAKKGDVMGSSFKFAMMGHIFRKPDAPVVEITVNYTKTKESTEEVKMMRDTYVGSYNKSENVLIDCDEWIPREWGYFICVLNTHGLKRLASGAALYSRGLLFGIGSFTLFKGNESIIVFTDVRPYESLITNKKTGPCTKMDQFGN